MRVLKILVIGFVLFGGIALSGEDGFTQEDRERLICLEATPETFMKQIDKRFEQVNNMFEQLYIFLGILAGIFTTLTAVVIGFAWWDRRTIIREAKRQTLDELEKETKPEKLRKLLNALWEKANTDEGLRKLPKGWILL